MIIDQGVRFDSAENLSLLKEVLRQKYRTQTGGAVIEVFQYRQTTVNLIRRNL